MNGSSKSTRVPTPGIWAPAITFIDPKTDSLSLSNQKTYYNYLSKHLTGLVILGTNAETFMLTREERRELLRTARSAVPEGYEIMAGVGGHSSKQVLEFVRDAVDEGADYVLVLPAAYFGPQTKPEVVMGFYGEVAATCEQLGVGLVLYNFPGVCNGIDLDSDTISTLARRHPSIVGVKLTCGSVAKITRLAAEFTPDQFAIFGGQADFLFAGLAVGSSGAISAFANVCPKTLRRIYDLYMAGEHAEALKLQRVTAFGEVIGRSGIANTKFAVSMTSARAAGIEGAEELLAPRRPYVPLDEAGKEVVRKKIAASVKIEQTL